MLYSFMLLIEYIQQRRPKSITKMLFNIDRNAKYNRPLSSKVIVPIFHSFNPPMRFYNSILKHEIQTIHNN